MNIKTILDAMSALDKAARALRCGDLDISAQVRLASECNTAEIELQLALQRDFPDVKIVEKVD